MLGGIELGGTKIVCAIGDDYGNIINRCVIKTETPEKNIKEISDYFRNSKIDALGIGTFGPVELNKKSIRYGYITTTPKEEWSNVDIVSPFKELNVPIELDTDVNAACLGEVKHGTGKGISNVIYGTIGTGIGFGVNLEDKLIHGLMHTESGHILLAKHHDDSFNGVCDYHSNCFESLASGPAIEKRWGNRAEYLYDKKEVWDLEAYYIGQALCNYIMCYSPEKIILGGGVMHVPGLIEKVRVETLRHLNGYIKKDEIINGIDEYIVLPKLGDNAGIIGAFELAKSCFDR